jgi:hypothetical protein
MDAKTMMRIYKTMMRIYGIYKPKALLAICFLVAVFWFGIPTAKTAWQVARERKSGDKIQGIVQRIRKQCVSRFDRKHDFVDLNGLFCRLCGIRVCNRIVRLDNGFLIPIAIGKGNPRAAAKNVIGFSRFLKERKIPFLYVQAPCKMDMGKKMLPAACHHHAYEDADEFLSALVAAKVDALDLRPFFAASVEDVERYFYRTDHHWNGDAIFEAFRLTAKRMADVLGVSEQTIHNEINPSSWHRRMRQNWFLGSSGRRTGRFFGGLDELIWYEPRFLTQQSYARLQENEWGKGDFSTAVVRRDYIDRRPDLFTQSAYDLYGGSRPLVCYRNGHAPVKKRLVVVGDSFSHPVWTLCSTVFAEIDVLDPRLWQKSTVAEYVLQTKPDIVVQLVNSHVFGALKCFRYGTPEAIRWERSTFVRDVQIHYETAPDAIDTIVVPEIRRGFNYIVDATGFTGAPLPDMVELDLCNVRSGNVWKRMMFDTEFCNKQKRVHWAFSVPEVGDWDLRIKGKGSNLIRFENLKVTELRPGKNISIKVKK